MTFAQRATEYGTIPGEKGGDPMKQFISVLTVLLLAGTMLFAQESKPKTYSLVLAGAV
jgi:hypothetical protein